MIELSGITETGADIGVAGDTFNTAVYLSRLGVDVAYATAVGDCPFSARLRTAFGDEGVNCDYVLTVAGASPGLYGVSVDSGGERSFTYWRECSAARRFFHADGCDEIVRAIADADLFYLSGITLSLFAPEERERLFDLMAEIRSRGGTTAFDSNYRPRGWSDENTARETVSRAIELATLTLPTLEDENTLFGEETAQQCAARHRQLGATRVVVKDGANGAYLTTGEWVSPPQIIVPIDTTGAGDSFNAGYLAAMLRGGSDVESALAGHRLAAEVIRTHGAILSAGHPRYGRRF